MAKIARKTAIIFGAGSGFQEVAEFGSLAAGGIAYSLDPAVIQSLSNWFDGWFSAVLGGNSPAIEDMNAFCYVDSYQLAYLMQEGVAEWDAGTTYYIGSIVNDGTGVLYVSLINNNLNNAVTNTTDWRPLLLNVVSIDPSVSSPYQLTNADNGKTFLVNSATGAMVFTLPATPSKNFNFQVKDSGNDASTNNITINQFASETIDGLSSAVINTNYGFIGMVCDGTNYFITAKLTGINTWTGYTSGASWSASGGSYNDGSPAGTPTVTTRLADGITATQASSNKAGIAFTPSSATAVYRISAKTQVAAASNSANAFRLWDGTTEITTEGNQLAPAGTNLFPCMLEGTYKPGTTSPVEVWVQFATTSSTGLESSFISPAIEWMIEQTRA